MATDDPTHDRHESTDMDTTRLTPDNEPAADEPAPDATAPLHGSKAPDPEAGADGPQRPAAGADGPQRPEAGGPSPDDLVAGTWDRDGGSAASDSVGGQRPDEGRGATPPPPPPPPAPPASWPAPSQPAGLTAETRNWAMGAHLSAFAGAWVALAFLGPLVVWLLKREQHPFIDHHAKEALNFNLTMFGLGVLGVVAIIITLGIGAIVVVPLALVFFVAWVAFPIVAAIRASNGESYRYPLSVRLVK